MTTSPLAETGRHPLTVALPQPRTGDADNRRYDVLAGNFGSPAALDDPLPEPRPAAHPRAVELLLGDTTNPAHWQDRALCAQTDPESFFPEKGGSTRDAKRICSGCDVRAECLSYALANDERFGIWGGLSERERRRIRRARA